MTPRSYLGVDPGHTGALAVVDESGALIWVEDMPDPLAGGLIRELMDGELLEAVAIEQVHSMPRQGVASSFKFGMAYGIVIGALSALGIPSTLVTPTVWKKTMRVTADKSSSRARAIELWPRQAQMFARKKDDGRAEAALIARWLSDQREGRAAA